MERLAPLEERIRDEIYKRINLRYSDYTKRLPSESDLAQEFSVSRATIRAALSLLASQGIVKRKHGSGTYINHEILRLRLQVGTQWEFGDLIRSFGYEPGITFLDSGLDSANEETANALEITPGDEILVIHKLFSASGKPAIYTENILSLELMCPPHDPDKLRGPIFHYLEEDYNESPAYSVADIFSVNAHDQLAELLGVEPNKAVLLL